MLVDGATDGVIGIAVFAGELEIAGAESVLMYFPVAGSLMYAIGFYMPNNPLRKFVVPEYADFAIPGIV